MAGKQLYESKIPGHPQITLRTEKVPLRRYDMATSTGTVVPIGVDVHDEWREDEYRALNALPGGVSPLVQDHVTGNPDDPVLPTSVWDQAGNRVYEGRNKPAIRYVHVKREFAELLEQLRVAQKAKEQAAHNANPQNAEKADLVIAASQAMAAALREQAKQADADSKPAERTQKK